MFENRPRIPIKSKIVSSTDGAGKIRYSHAKKLILAHNLYHLHKLTQNDLNT